MKPPASPLTCAADNRWLPCLLGCALAAAIPATAAPIKVGIIGLDAHAVPWTEIIHNPTAAPPVSNLRIAAAVPAPSPDIPFSRDHIEQNTARMRALGVEICSSIDQMLPKVDAVMVLSIDGRPHPRQARAAFAARKPVFIDKPVAASLADIVQIDRDAKAAGTPWFSNSSLRYSAGIAGMTRDPRVGRVLGCDAYGNNVSILPGHPSLFYYGIHGCEILFTIMGPGCRTVSRVHGDAADLAVGTWADGRMGTFRGILRGATAFGATVFGEKGIAPAGKFEGYEPLIAQIATFFATRQPPISLEHTLEIYAFMEAADESLRRGGRPVSIPSVLNEARAPSTPPEPPAQRH
ncbi:MAG: Gfo/Idh/MocA family oxidoreductase [Verrucomicrobia bacterium]|nr:Gfo/Idh/MocA family oxidoreductase [Verrucomicrobiota bacterium]